MMMSTFKRKARVKVTNQNSEFRNQLGTVVGSSSGFSGRLINVRLDGRSRGRQRQPIFFGEGELGLTNEENPFDDYVPDKTEAGET
jgi:hypothetical protein